MTTEASSVPPLAAAPPERIDLGGDTALLRCDAETAERAVEAINASLDHLRPWMAWANEPATLAGMSTFYAASTELWDQCRDFGFTVFDEATNAVIGGAGLHNRLGPGGLEIGYWLHVDHTGRGMATRIADALTRAAFELDGIGRVEIHCEEHNHRSARVPEKLGYTFHGLVVPEGGPCAGRSTQIWAVTEPEWRTRAP